MKTLKNLKSTTLIVLSIFLLAFSFNAQAETKAVEAPENTKTVNVTVNGLVCDFCARALEKVFSKRKEVDSINVDLDNALVQIFVKQDESIDDETLTKLITDSGYNVTKIERL